MTMRHLFRSVPNRKTSSCNSSSLQCCFVHILPLSKKKLLQFGYCSWPHCNFSNIAANCAALIKKRRLKRPLGKCWVESTWQAELRQGNKRKCASMLSVLLIVRTTEVQQSFIFRVFYMPFKMCLCNGKLSAFLLVHVDAFPLKTCR